MHEVEDNTAQGILMKHRLSQVRDPVELERHPLGSGELLPLARPCFNRCAQILRGALDGGYTSQGQIILQEVLKTSELSLDLGECPRHHDRAAGAGGAQFLL